MFKKSSSTVNGITEGVIWQQILLYFFPILLGTFFQQMYNTVDAVIVGKFVGTEALAAVGGSAGTLMNLLIGFFVGLSSGATVIIAQFYGSGDRHKVSDAVHTAFALSLVGGVIMMLVGIPLSRTALRWVGTPEDILNLSATYMHISFAGVIPSLVYNIGSGILRAVGDSRRPLYFLIICCVANIVLDLVFVVGFRMGVAGVAIATALAQTISAALVIITLVRSEASFQLHIRRIRFYGNILGNIVKIGLPAGLQSVMYSISNILLQSAINAFGTIAIAANSACGKLDGIMWMVMGAFGVTTTTFVGQNFGAQKFDRMRKVVRTSLLMTAIGTVTLEILLFVFAEPALSLFTSDVDVLKEGVHILRFLAPCYVLYMSIEILAGTLRGTGDSVVPLIFTACGVCLIRVLWVVFGSPYFTDVNHVLFSYPLTWAITSTLFIVYYLRGKWLARRKLAMGFSLEESK